MKFDGLIEAVRYTPEGRINIVRAYERRGATFSDCVILNRSSLVERLKKGQKFMTGVRTAYMGSTFKTGKYVQLNGDVINTSAGSIDKLDEVPTF